VLTTSKQTWDNIIGNEGEDPSQEVQWPIDMGNLQMNMYSNLDPALMGAGVVQNELNLNIMM
jgi:hypothetical protein